VRHLYSQAATRRKGLFRSSRLLSDRGARSLGPSCRAIEARSALKAPGQFVIRRDPSAASRPAPSVLVDDVSASLIWVTRRWLTTSDASSSTRAILGARK